MRSGLDGNGNGVLDDSEISHTDYVCDGPVLVRKDPIAPGGACPNLGTAVHTGVDRNGNGVLDDAEIDQTTTVCGPRRVWNGDFQAADWADATKVSALVTASVVAGNLEIDTDDAVIMPVLEQVTGNLRVRTHVSTVELAGLRVVDGDATIDVSPSRTPFLPALERIGGTLRIDEDAAATGGFSAGALAEVDGDVQIGAGVRGTLAVPTLRTVGGDVTVAGDSGVSRIELAGLERVAGSMIFGGPALLEISIPAAHSIGGQLEIGNAPELTSVELGTTSIGGSLLLIGDRRLATLSLPKLTSVHGDQRFGAAIFVEEMVLPVLELPVLQQAPNISIQQNPGLTAVRLPELTACGRIDIERNPVLESVSAPRITTLDDLSISNNDTQIGMGVLHEVDFGALTTVTGAVVVEDAKLADLSGFRKLETTHRLTLFNIAQLPDLKGLASIRQVPSLQILWALALTSLDGIEAVTDLSLALELEADPVLADLAGARNVTRVGFLTLNGLPKLEDLSGLVGVQSVSGQISFGGDPGLSPEEIAAFMQQIGR